MPVPTSWSCNMADTFLCEGCGRTLPRYINGEHQPSCGMNLGWGMMEWCRKCRPPGGTVKEIVEQFDSFMFPPKELPDNPDERSKP